MHYDFNPREATKYWPLQEHEAHIFLKSLLDTPENVKQHIRRLAGQIEERQRTLRE